MDKDKVKSLRRSSIIVLLILLVIGTAQVLMNKSGSITCQVDANNSMLGVLGAYGDSIFINLSDIEEVSLVETLDCGEMVEGKETSQLRSGTYKNSEFGEYSLHVYIKSASYIVLHYDGGKVLVFNQSRAKTTEQVYESILENMP